jgi:hypothetical protein
MATPLICWFIEGDVESADGCSFEVKMKLRHAPSENEFFSFKEEAKLALQQQTQSPIVSDTISLIRADGGQWW